MSTEPNQADVDEVRGLLDLMADFSDNDQRARYLLSSNWMRDRGAAAAANIQGGQPGKTITIRPGSTPAKDLPVGMTFDVCDVLDAYGLKVKDESLKGLGIVEVRQALFGIINAIPAEQGGRGLAPGPSRT